MKSFFRNHKLLIIIIVIILIVIGIMIGLFSLVEPDYHKSLYGNRLENIKEHKIESKKIDKIEKDITDLDYISKFDYNLKGKIMNFVITVSKDTSIDTSKKLGTIILDNLDKKEKGYYDIQVFVITDDKNDNYPIIGYKHRTSEGLVWTK